MGYILVQWEKHLDAFLDLNTVTACHLISTQFFATKV